MKMVNGNYLTDGKGEWRQQMLMSQWKVICSCSAIGDINFWKIKNQRLNSLNYFMFTLFSTVEKNWKTKRKTYSSKL